MQTCDKNDFSDNSLLLSSRQINLTVGKRISFCESSSETHCDCHTNVGRAGHRGDKVAHRQLCAVIVLCAIFMVVEIIGGVLSNSLALFTDVLHLASDLTSYVISLFALCLSRRGPTRSMTFGYHRAEVVGAVVSVFIIWLVSGVLCYMATERIVRQHYRSVQPDEMLVTAAIGVGFNLVMMTVLHSGKCHRLVNIHSPISHGHAHHESSRPHQKRNILYQPISTETRSTPLSLPLHDRMENGGVKGHQRNINIRAACVHMFGDILQSIGVLMAAVIIKLNTDERFRLADPICTFIFSLLVLGTTVGILRDALRVIMEGRPPGVDYERLKHLFASTDSVVSVHDLNVWSLTIGRDALSVHLAVDGSVDSYEVVRLACKAVRVYNFVNTTIQVDFHNEGMSGCPRCALPSD